MLPRANKPLAALTQDTTTLDELETLLKENDYNGLPVVVSRESQFLVGFVLRRDVILAVGNSLFSIALRWLSVNNVSGRFFVNCSKW